MKSNETAKKKIVYNSLKHKYIKFICAWVLFCILVCLHSSICVGYMCRCRLATPLKKHYTVSLFRLCQDSSTPWLFTPDNNSPLRGNVEGCYTGLFISKLFATCWGVLFQVFRLGYRYLRWVCLGFVSGSVVRI